MPDTLTLADVVSRNTPVEWYEGVAIAQALCDGLTARRGESPFLVPELDRIEIRSDGTVAPDEGAGDTGQPPVQGVGRVLLALVSEHRMPVQLRLLGLTAISPTSSYASPADLSSALAYFARPDRTAQVCAVRARCAHLPPPAPVESAPVPVRARAKASPAGQPKVPARRRVPFTALAVAVVVLGAAALGVVWVLVGNGRPGMQGSLAGAVSGTAQRVGDAAVTVARSVGNRLGLAPPAPAFPAPPAEPTAETASASAVPRRRAMSGVLPPVLPVTAWTPLAVSTSPVDETVFATVAEGGDFAALPAVGYYTDADGEVTPPTLLRPRLPRVPAGGTRMTELPHVDLLVTVTGEVEWVRLWPADVTVYSTMMLSAIKNWRFEPARKNGLPVRYRQTIALTSQ